MPGKIEISELNNKIYFRNLLQLYTIRSTFLSFQFIHVTKNQKVVATRFAKKMETKPSVVAIKDSALMKMVPLVTRVRHQNFCTRYHIAIKLTLNELNR